MKHLKSRSYSIKIVGGLLALVFVCFLTIALLRTWYPSHANKKDAPVQTATNEKQDIAQASKNNDGPTKQAAVPPTPSSSSPACRRFTKPLADQVLKADARLNTESAVTSDNGDLQVSFCTYTVSERAVTLVTYIAKTDVGKSMNSVEFGSGRPAGVQNITTIGQAAFWNSALATLSVLKNNNRYSIALTNGTLDQTIEAAKTIIPNM